MMHYHVYLMDIQVEIFHLHTFSYNRWDTQNKVFDTLYVNINIFYELCVPSLSF
jgi:hypothetical protein